MDSYNNENLDIAENAAGTGAANAEGQAARTVTVAQGNVQHVATPPAGEQTTVAVVPIS